MKNYIRGIILSLFCAIALAASVQAASIDYGALGNFILQPNSTLAANGSRVRVGTFTSGFDFSLNSTNYTALNNAFTEFGNTTIADAGSGNSPGQFFATTPFLSGISGVQIYLWLFNTPVASNATAWAIITNNAANWKGTADGPTSTSIDASDSGVFVPSGALGQIVGGNGGNIRMSAVPEPTVSLLLLLGGFLPILPRRRR